MESEIQNALTPDNVNIIKKYIMGTKSNDETVKDEVDILAQAFEEVCRLFDRLELLMLERRNYHYDDGEYKDDSEYRLEMGLVTDAFDKIKQETLPSIKSISADYRKKIISEFMTEQDKAIKRLITLAEALSPHTKWKTLANERTCAMILHYPVGAGVINETVKFMKQSGYKYNWIQAAKYLPIANIVYEISKEKFDYVLLDEFDGVSLDTQERVLDYIKSSDHNRRIIIAVHKADLLTPQLLQSCFYLDIS